MYAISDLLNNFSLLIINSPESRTQSKWKSRGILFLHIVRSLFACVVGILSIPSHLSSYLSKDCYTEIMALDGFIMTYQGFSWVAYCCYNLYGRKNLSKMLRKFDDIHYRIKLLDVNVTLSHHRKIINAMILVTFILTIYLAIYIVVKLFSRHLGSFLSFIIFVCLAYHNIVMFLWTTLLVFLESILINFICIELAGLTSVKNPWSLKFRRIYHRIYYNVGIVISDAFGLIMLSFVYYCFGSTVLTSSAVFNPQFSCIMKTNSFFRTILSIFLLSILEFGECARRRVSINKIQSKHERMHEQGKYKRAFKAITLLCIVQSKKFYD